MSYRRALSVLLAAAAATMLVTGSFGFTSVSAERGVSVTVVESENAYVNATACEKSNGNGNGVKVTIANQFSSDFTVEEISWSASAHPSKEKLTPGKEIRAGNSRTFPNAFGDEEVTVVVSGDLDATVTVPVEGKCRGNGVTTGSSNANGTNGNGTND